jgi:MOSC domain-containing protein YiiM
MGRVSWIGLRPGRREGVRVVEEATFVAGRGIHGDRYEAAGGAGARQVTLIQAEHLDVMARLLGLPRVDPALLRRNVVVSGINLVALRNARFRIGSALLEGAGDCAPCSRMEEALGPGGYNAMRGHGGILARVLEGGTVRVGAAVVFDSATQEPDPDPP